MSLINDAISEMLDAGLIVKDGVLNLDCGIHRLPTTQKPNKTDGWYIGSEKQIGGKDYVCVTYSNYITGEKVTYKSWKNDTNIPTAHKDQLLKQINAQKVAAEAVAEKTAKEAAEKSFQKWETLSVERERQHAYFTNKNVNNYGLRFGENWKGNFTAVPIFDIDGHYKGMQRIYEDVIPGTDRNKEFDFGMSKKCGHFIIGAPPDRSANEPLLFAEGYATAASIFEATGYTTIVCFDAGNLYPVVEAYRELFPSHNFIICADNDEHLETNVGFNKAKIAAKKFNCNVALPTFLEEHKIQIPSDFNDYHNLYGLVAVKKAIDLVIREHVQEPLPQEKNKSKIPELKDRPCFFVSEEFFCIDDKNKKPGLYYFDTKMVGKEKTAIELVETWICSPFYVDAISSDNKGNSFGRLIRFINAKKQWCSLILPMSFLASQSCEKLFDQLLDKGLLIDPRHKNLLLQYVHTHTPQMHVETIMKTGWHEGAFVLTDKTFGNSELYYQAEGLPP
ncbi:DUF927 domain-containing protein [Methylomonas montana]|uniref:DUF927 domain-containing protein n=1 Tax=Methylomonas montana TaxID=3058963 RepID=UPI00265B0F23|nr:DUF927 domain-containing protein [Methylomonas montana]WKJ88605.1 DUF927 domain-containing protein [Methylomonas montana]